MTFQTWLSYIEMKGWIECQLTDKKVLQIGDSIVNRGNNLKRSWGFFMFLMGMVLLFIIILVSKLPIFLSSIFFQVKLNFRQLWKKYSVQPATVVKIPKTIQNLISFRDSWTAWNVLAHFFMPFSIDKKFYWSLFSLKRASFQKI